MIYSFQVLFESSLKGLPFSFPCIEGEIVDPIFVNECLKHLENIQVNTFKYQDFNAVSRFTITAIEDIIKAKKSLDISEEMRTNLNFIQFYLTLKPLSYAVESGQQNLALSWINHSMSDDLSEAQSKILEVIRLQSYLLSKSLQQVVMFNEVAHWVGNFYYICRQLSAYHNIAEDILGISIVISQAAFKCQEYEAFSWAYSNVISWGISVNNVVAKKLVLEIELILDNNLIPLKYETLLVLLLTTNANQYSNKGAHEWAEILISKYDEYLIGHQKLQALVTLLPQDDAESAIYTIKLIRHEILILKKELNKILIKETPSRKYIEQDRLFGIIASIIEPLLSIEKTDLLFQVLFDWYQVSPEDTLDGGRALLILPKGISGLTLCIGNRTVLHERDISATYRSLIEASNQFLGVSHSIVGDHEFKFWNHLPDRMGVPNELLSNELYSKLLDFYCFEIAELNQFINVNIDLIDSYVSLPSTHYPVQYLMLKTIGKCWPLGASLKKANPDRAIVKVCLWCGAGSLTEQIESELLTRFFQSMNVEVTLFRSNETTKNEFIKIYESNDFDIIWVMSHGEFDHWKPGVVSVEIGNNQYLSLDEALNLSIPESDKRRLLFLNICDGATHSGSDGLERLGFAPSLANNNQCVISHLWPVTAWSAATFGAIYSSYLTSEGNFFTAFESTLNVMTGGNIAVMNRLSEVSNHCQDLIDRLNNQNNDFDLIANSGSSVFIQ